MSRRAELAGLLVAGLLLGLAAPAGAAPGHHGVDPVRRYIYKDSASPFGPAIDPEPADDALVIDDADEGEVDVPLPFDFDLFDVTYTEASIGVNGVLAFTASEDLPGLNPDLAVAGTPVVAPWWDDWELGPTGSVSTRTFGPAVDQTFVVRWRVRPAGGTGYVDFELLLREQEDLIEFQYVDTTTDVGLSDGASGSIGLRGFPYSQDEAVLDPAAFAIRWTPVFCHGHRATRLGTFGNDSIWGGPGRNVIVALSGNDSIWARGSDDIVCGSRGRDSVWAGIGNDQIWGEFGDDVLYGGHDADAVNGGGGRDVCYGNPGLDTQTGCESISGIP